MLYEQERILEPEAQVVAGLSMQLRSDFGVLNASLEQS